MGHIGFVYIDGVTQDENEITAPPERMLEVLVIEGIVSLRIVPYDKAPDAATDAPWRTERSEGAIDVPARSLLLALQALVEDDELPKPARLD